MNTADPAEVAKAEAERLSKSSVAVSPALGGERDDEIIKYGRLECLVKYHGRGQPIQLADEMDIDLEEICLCEGRALTKMSMLGQVFL